MPLQDFIFIPSIWLGEGKISFSSSHDFIKFYTKWQITQEKPGIMKAIQTVEMQGIDEQLINEFTFTDLKPLTFSVTLENNIVGIISGTGLRDTHLIGWEFRGQMTFEGFEVYEQQENGDYFLHAEYGSPEQYRTIIEGLIWRKGT